MPSASKLAEQLVRGSEDLRIFDAQAGELVHVEKAPIVDLVRRRAPVRQPVSLRLEQLVQRIEAVRVPIRR